MCQWCEKERAERDRIGEDYYGIICPQLAGRTTGRIIGKRINGENLSVNEEELLKSFCELTSPTICGVPIKDVPNGGIFIERFGKKTDS